MTHRTMSERSTSELRPAPQYLCVHRILKSTCSLLVIEAINIAVIN